MFLIHKMLNMLFRYYSCLEVTEHKQHSDSEAVGVEEIMSAVGVGVHLPPG